jgi:hypothetical protein
MPSDASAADPSQLPSKTGAEPLQRQVLETYVWAVQAGLRAAVSNDLFDGFCQRMILDGVPLWRAYAATATLHRN